jgi:type I restriction enzyme S subunit
MIDVLPHYLEIVSKILQTHVPECEVRAFGSRITQTAKPYSDLDLVVVGKERLANKIIYALKDDFEESDLPFRVDVLDWYSISKEFRKVVEKNFLVIQKGSL